MSDARRFLVRGRVQGVYFRDSTRREAERLGLTGHAINLPNGDVEVVCHGEARAIDALAGWLAQGPPLARVDEIVEEPAVGDDVPGGFRTG